PRARIRHLSASAARLGHVPVPEPAWRPGGGATSHKTKAERPAPPWPPGRCPVPARRRWPRGPAPAASPPWGRPDLRSACEARRSARPAPHCVPGGSTGWRKSRRGEQGRAPGRQKGRRGVRRGAGCQPLRCYLPRCPPGKKAAAAGWLCCAGAPPGPPEVPCEEMEQVGPEQQCEAARRRLQEIEDRITEEEEEEEEEEGLAGRPEGHLPILVLSHTLQTGLKQDYEGNLTKKIIESMSRPSMELVLWKPLPEFLPEKGGPVSIKGYKPLVTEIRLGKLAALEAAFPSQTDKFLTQSQQAEMPLAQFGAGGSNGPAEEEMEL
uniref:Coiled-coil domain containing 117 n=1 Tax=Pseudonaja textilis TaxID=8673 RepID=A0A670ZYM1_PSETE